MLVIFRFAVIPMLLSAALVLLRCRVGLSLWRGPWLRRLPWLSLRHRPCLRLLLRHLPHLRLLLRYLSWLRKLLRHLP